MGLFQLLQNEAERDSAIQSHHVLRRRAQLTGEQLALRSHFDGAVEFTLQRSIDLERCYCERHCQRDGRAKTDEKLFADGPRRHYLLQNYGLKSKASVVTALVGSPF